MKYFLILLVLIGFVGHVSAEETFSGHSSIDPPVSEITPRKPTAVNVLFQYTSGPYAITNLSPQVEITPQSAKEHVKIDIEPIELNRGDIRRIPIMVTVDQDIPNEKIFLAISFSGKHFQTGELYKSSWIESTILDIAPRDMIGFELGDCTPIEIDYEISGDKEPIFCKSQSTNSVKAFVDAKNNGTITLDIPKHVLYGIGSTDCKLDNNFFVIHDGKEVAADITEKEDRNLVSVDFESGIHEIEIIGTFILPSPSPVQYCGIVENYPKVYLPPLDQIQRDMKPSQIRCNDDLVLLHKYDDSPACVTESTKLKLIERGWTTKDSSAQKIIERIKQDTQAVNEVDARYIETLALMNQTVSNFVYGVEWTSHCCGYSENNNSSEITITFLDSDNQKQLGVTFDLDTMQITDIHQSNTVSIGKGLSSEPDPYRLIALREFPNESSYYHKINNISEIPYISKINENKTTITTSEQFNELLEWFPQKCLENNSDSYDCSNTPPIFEYDSTKYLIVSHGLDSNEVYCESGLLHITDYEKECPDRNVEDFVPVKCVTPPTKEHLFDK